MWCQQCRQDVPAAFSVETGQYRCTRCAASSFPSNSGDATGSGTTQQPPNSGGEDKDGAAAATPPLDYWELDEQLRHVERVLAAGKKGGNWPPPGSVLRTDPAHPRVKRHSRRKRASRRRGETEAPSALRVLIWPFLALGMMTSVCGGVLVAWSLVAGRSELWTMGLPIALLGQIGLLVGLVLELERMWVDQCTTAAKLDRFEEELHNLKTVTLDLLAVRLHQSDAPS